jgi:RimJ/RimL family protein N-acetyltransferase
MIRLVTELPKEAREWRNDPRIMDWCRQNELISEEDQKRWEERIKTDTTVKMFGVQIEDPREVKILKKLYVVAPKIGGVLALTSLNRNHRSAEFSLYIAPPYQGKGHGKEALLALLRYGFCNMNLHCIWGETFLGNPAMKLFESVGFVNEGVHRHRYRKKGLWTDAYSISMLEEEYFDKYGH